MEVKLTSATSFTDHDVVATDVFVKVNCPPYLLQLDLFGAVVPEKTEITVSKPCIKFKFFKQTKVPPSKPITVPDTHFTISFCRLFGET